jgi:hypothetical protein
VRYEKPENLTNLNQTVLRLMLGDDCPVEGQHPDPFRADGVNSGTSPDGSHVPASAGVPNP